MVNVWIIVLVAVIFIFFYNTLVRKRNQIHNAEGSLDAVLKQRFDLIPQLVEVAKQYMEHEEGLFTRLIELRSLAKKTASVDEKNKIDKELAKEMKTLTATFENYPQLLSNNNFVRIQDAMIDLEKNIAAARRFYNTSIVEYNDAIQMFPGVLFAPLMGFKKREYYSIEESEREIPDVKNLFKK